MNKFEREIFNCVRVIKNGIKAGKVTFQMKIIIFLPRWHRLFYHYFVPADNRGVIW